MNAETLKELMIDFGRQTENGNYILALTYNPHKNMIILNENQEYLVLGE